MDLKELNNLNMDDIKAKVIAFADKKTLIKGGIAFGAIVFFLVIYYSILNPIVNTKKAQLADMTLKQEEIVQFTNEIKSKKNKLPIVLKGTKVDGVYDKDPEKHKDAKKYEYLSYQKVIQDNLRVMDMTAITLCKENNIPIKVFSIKNSGNLLDIVMGSKIGTTIGK